jgi:branched-chain amino acid transport system substrate-binding protein
MSKRIIASLALGLGLGWAVSASAQETLKIGVILPYSGPFADAANQLQAGIDLYIAQHGGEVAGRKIELVKKDTGGPNADAAQRAAQELVVRDQVDIIAGFALTPEALGAAPVSAEVGKMMVVMNAATSIVTERSPMIVRTSVTIPQLNYAFGKWAYEEGGVKQAYTLVADYGPGHDAEASFSKGFTEAGGQILGSDRTPVANPDFSAYVQRVKDAHPEAVYIFYETLKKTNGDATGSALVEAAKGMAWDSPRGPVMIDPETRDIVQTVYIREVQEVDGTLQNVIIHSIPEVKDPLHGAN